MFNPKGVAVTIAHINLRDERHGDETVSAADLKCKTTLANSWLDQFAPGLLSSLYKPDPTQDFESADHQPHLRFPMIVMLPLKHEIVGANILIERGSTGDLDIHLECV